MSSPYRVLIPAVTVFFVTSTTPAGGLANKSLALIPFSMVSSWMTRSRMPGWILPTMLTAVRGT